MSTPTIIRQGSSPLTRGKPVSDQLTGNDRGLIPAHAGKTGGRPSTASSDRAHPRSRGENWWGYSGEGSEQGSSPLTRGKQAGGLPPLRAIGLIPAHAGKTGGATRAKAPSRAHPRSRGENIIFKNEAGDRMGSSPLTRGKPESCEVWQGACRLIPAHAGKTS